MKSFNEWHCQTCELSKPMSFEECKAHLAEVHGLKTREELSGELKLIYCEDGDGYAFSRYQFAVKSRKGPVVMINDRQTVQERRGK